MSAPQQPEATAHPRADGPLLIGTRNPDAGDGHSLSAMNEWQRKTNAVVQVFVRSDRSAADVVDVLDRVWRQGGVPSVSFDLQAPNAAVVSGAIDADLDPLIVAMTRWLSGPDGVLDSDDDRRAYFRPAWEPNGTWYRWSPCHVGVGGGSIDDYKAMWRYLHAKFAGAGVDRTRLAWIYSVNATDGDGRCRAESLFPGVRYVDWLGVDGYTFTSSATPTEVFEPMFARLRALAPDLPLSVNEWGADSVTTLDKSAWIADYFALLHHHDVRMSVSFNLDKERDWAVFGGLHGDETFVAGGATHRAWRSYRLAVEDPRVSGSDHSDPRLLTDRQFLGREP